MRSQEKSAFRKIRYRKVWQHSPQIIDKLTPDGKVPEGSMLEKSLSALADKYLKG